VDEPADPTAFFLGVDDSALRSDAQLYTAIMREGMKEDGTMSKSAGVVLNVDGEDEDGPLIFEVYWQEGDNPSMDYLGVIDGDSFVPDRQTLPGISVMQIPDSVDSQEAIVSWLEGLVGGKVKLSLKTAVEFGELGTPAERREMAKKAPGHAIFLEQHPDGKFNLQGPQVLQCAYCDRLLEASGYASAADNEYQRHLSIDHGISAPLLPKGAAAPEGNHTYRCNSCGHHGSSRASNGVPSDCPKCGGSSGLEKVAYEPHRSNPIETLRNQTCPVCMTKNSWDGNICTVCGYVLPPRPFQAPNTDVTNRIDPDEGWFDPDAKKADPFNPVPEANSAMKGQKVIEGEPPMADRPSIAAAARQRLAAKQAETRRQRMAAEDGGGTITEDVVPAAEAPAESTEETINEPEAQGVDVETVGGVTETPTADVTGADVTSVGGEMATPAPLDVQDTEKPIAGATEVDPEASSEDRPNNDESAESADYTPTPSGWNTAQRRAAVERQLGEIRTSVRDRIFSSLHLARLRVQANIADTRDDLVLARQIEESGLSNEAIANEISSLRRVVTAQREAVRQVPVPQQRQAGRRSPSLAGGTPTFEHTASLGEDDEFLFT
jgi:hypothetical protein